MTCPLCETGKDEVWGDVFPAELVDIRGDVAWRHPHKRDQMFSTLCKNQEER